LKEFDHKWTSHQLFVNFEKAHKILRGEAVNNILVEFEIPTKLVI